MNDGEEIQLRASQMAVALGVKHQNVRDPKPRVEPLLAGLKGALQRVASQVPQVEDCLVIEVLETSVLCRLSTVYLDGAPIFKTPWDDYPAFQVHVCNEGTLYRRTRDHEGKEISLIPMSLQEMHEIFKEWLVDWIVTIYPRISESRDDEAEYEPVRLVSQYYYFLLIVFVLAGGYFLIKYT